MKILLLSFLVLLLSNCNTVKESNPFGTNQKRWKKANIQNYHFVVEKSCFCPFEENKHILVQNTSIKEAKYIPSNILIDTTDEPTIDGYFSMIQNALNDHTHDVKVQYHTRYGFPTKIFIKNNTGITDTAITYTLSHFHTGNGEIGCTKEYRPVCGKVNVECFTTPCESIEQTFSNRCMLDANPNATYLRDGTC